MFSPSDRSAIVRAARCLQSLDGYQTLHAVAALAGIKRLQDAFREHVAMVAEACKDCDKPGVAAIWVPDIARGPFTTSASIATACKALEDENPSLEGSLSLLWPGAQDAEVAAAWKHMENLDWRTEPLLGGWGPEPRAPIPLPEEESLAAKLRNGAEAGLHDEASGDPDEHREDTELREMRHTDVHMRCLDVVGEAYEAIKVDLKINPGDRRGEFFTPTNVCELMVRMSAPEPGQSISDPACGSGRMLVITAGYLLSQHGHHLQVTGSDHPMGEGHRFLLPPPALLVGQDIAPHGPAMGRISLTALGYLNCVFVVADTLSEPATMEQVRAIVVDRQARLLANHPKHLVTPDLVKALAFRPGQAQLDGAPARIASTARPTPRAARSPASRTPSLEAFGAGTT